MAKKDYSGDKTPFNFAQLLLERLNDLFTDCNRARIDGGAFLWYKVLAAITSSISFKLTDEEIADLEKRLTKVRAKVRNSNSHDDVFYFDIEKELNDIEITIVKLMYKYELYYPKNEYQTIDEQLVVGYE